MAVQSVYLDYQASTPLDPRVRAIISDAYDSTGNASSEEHAFGWAAAKLVEKARALVADCVGAVSEEVVFTSGSTEANNIAILGAAAAAPPNRRRILISAIEHKSVSEAAFAAEKSGFSIELIAVTKDGLVAPETLSKLLGDDVAVVSIMAVNNEIGVIQDTATLGSLVRSSGAFFHVDATQALAATKVDIQNWNADALSLSGHKIYGPGGIGALIVSMDAAWRPAPISFGGGQETGLRPGTLPVALCAGLGEACKLITEGAFEERRQIADLRDRFHNMLLTLFPKLVITSEKSARHPGCLHVRLPSVDASDLLLKLQPLVAASTGSACTSGVMGKSHVLSAIGMTDEEASECVRFSIGRFTTLSQIIFASDTIAAQFKAITPKMTNFL
jgi:cysteine desulfurase